MITGGHDWQDPPVAPAAGGLGRWWGAGRPL